MKFIEKFKNIGLVLFVLLSAIIYFSCINKIEKKLPPEETWKLGWRMVENSWNKNYTVVEQQFDSLLMFADKNDLENKFYATGLLAKLELGKEDVVVRMLGNLSQEMVGKICHQEIALSKLPSCKNSLKEKVENKALQLELMEMYVSDQVARGNTMDHIIAKYNIDRSKIHYGFSVIVDEVNRSRLDAIIKENGFPTKVKVGRDGMEAVFYIIQHAGADEKWQKEQLPNIEAAVKRGDLDKKMYALLYDRVKILGGEKQLYGTQFREVDPQTKAFEMSETEDVDNLDYRRREMGLMPICIYERLIRAEQSKGVY